MKTATKRGVIFCVFFLAIAISTSAQINYGTLRGTVVDPSGGAVPGAEVTATDAATAAQYKSVTNGSGAESLAPGTRYIAGLKPPPPLPATR